MERILLGFQWEIFCKLERKLLWLLVWGFLREVNFLRFECMCVCHFPNVVLNHLMSIIATCVTSCTCFPAYRLAVRMLATFELDGVWRLGGACFSTGVMFWRVACVNCHLLKPLRFFDAQAFVPTLGLCCVYVCILRMYLSLGLCPLAARGNYVYTRPCLLQWGRRECTHVCFMSGTCYNRVLVDLRGFVCCLSGCVLPGPL